MQGATRKPMRYWFSQSVGSPPRGSTLMACFQKRRDQKLSKLTICFSKLAQIDAVTDNQVSSSIDTLEKSYYPLIESKVLPKDNFSLTGSLSSPFRRGTLSRKKR
ncbi:hypothetical protein O181_007662 [Austropuccinia psidii MF-1]|uniref:Uncharacterized protein n=1 Tax=Austropuccinia psidii MF-1 TaxID=1389203 RepID=A0A9Q3BMD2_9BASI|nr:hypothetical protein [Austropuccinia psidii MF-1]